MPEILAGCGDNPEDDSPQLNLAFLDSAAAFFYSFSCLPICLLLCQMAVPVLSVRFLGESACLALCVSLNIFPHLHFNFLLCAGAFGNWRGRQGVAWRGIAFLYKEDAAVWRLNPVASRAVPLLWTMLTTSFTVYESIQA